MAYGSGGARVSLILYDGITFWGSAYSTDWATGGGGGGTYDVLMVIGFPWSHIVGCCLSGTIVVRIGPPNTG